MPTPRSATIIQLPNYAYIHCRFELHTRLTSIYSTSFELFCNYPFGRKGTIKRFQSDVLPNFAIYPDRRRFSHSKRRRKDTARDSKENFFLLRPPEGAKRLSNWSWRRSACAADGAGSNLEPDSPESQNWWGVRFMSFMAE
jgi:hypothetical protein